MSLRDDIARAVGEGRIEGFEFVRLSEWESLLHRIAEQFLTRGVRDLDSIWMWNEFRDAVASAHPEDSIQYRRGQIQPAMRYWFIASDEHGKHWIADATGSAIVRIVEEMYFFEYSIVERHLDWILCENHHGVFVKAEAARNPGDGRA